MRSLLWVVAVTFLISCSAAAVLRAQLPPPILQDSSGTTIDPQALFYSSPYGPRALPASVHPNSYEYQFHWGVDYLYSFGTPIFAVQNGTVTQLNIDGHNDWLISVDGTINGLPRHFSYLHIFNNSWFNVTSLPTDKGGITVWAQACLNSNNLVPLSAGVSDSSCGANNQSDLVTLEASPCVNVWAIVFWQDFDMNVAKPNGVLSPCTGFKIGGVAATNKVSQGVVSQNNWIALIGNSGVADSGQVQGATTSGAHLHLQVDSGNENPLLFVQHDSPNPPGNPPSYDVTIFKDTGTSTGELNSNEMSLEGGGVVLNPATDSPLLVRAEVSYALTGQGHDLDAVEISMFSKNSPNPYSGGFCTGTGGVADVCFDYGGVYGPSFRTVFPKPPQTDPRVEDLAVAVQQGVYPQPGRGGVVDFLTETDPVDLTQLSPGSYLIQAKAMDILGDELDVAPLEVEVPPQLTVTVNGNGTVFSTPAGLNSGINNCGAGMTCSDWFDISNGVTLTATPSSGATFIEWGGDCSGTDETITVFTPSPTPVSMNCTATFMEWCYYIVDYGTYITAGPALYGPHTLTGIIGSFAGAACTAPDNSVYTPTVTLIEANGAIPAGTYPSSEFIFPSEAAMVAALDTYLSSCLYQPVVNGFCWH